MNHQGPAPSAAWRAARVWIGCAAVVAALLALAEWGRRLPPPAGTDAPATAFSEARAMPIVRRLAGEIGPRVPGTAGYEEAVSFLAERLRALPGVEVEVTEIRGSVREPDVPNLVRDFRARNVLARLPGRSPEAVMISAHLDSPAESPGASDNALSVAVAVEALRALSAGGALEHTVLLQLNGAEEPGTLGATAFLDHPWRAAVRAYVNLEGTPDGRAVVFQAGPESAWLMEAYARSVRSPFASSIAQDLFRAEVLAHYTDYRVYSDAARIPGIDMASYEDLWAYHTALDTPERIVPGTVQHMGDSALELTRALAGGPLEAPGRGEAVYFDVLGSFMVAYPRWAAPLLAAAALALAAGAIGLARARGRLSLRGLAAGAVAGLVAGLGAIGAAALGGALLPLIGRPHGWHAAPLPGVVAFAGLALAGGLGALRALQRRASVAASLGPDAAWGGALALWGAALAALTALGLSAAAIPLAWTLGGAIGLGLASWRPRAWWAALALSFAPGAALTLQNAGMFTRLLVGEAGLLDLPITCDPVLAALIGLSTAALLPVGIAALLHAGRLGRAALACGAVGLVALAVTAATFPYTPARPKRVFIAHGEDDHEVDLAFGSYDPLPIEEGSIALSGLSRRAQTELWFACTAASPAGPTGLPRPAVSVREIRRDAAAGTREVALRVTGEPFTELLLRIPAGSLSGWSLAPPPHPPTPDRPTALVWVIAPPRDGWEVSLTLRTLEPVRAELTGIDALRRTPDLALAIERLPPWATPHTRAFRRIAIEL